MFDKGSLNDFGELYPSIDRIMELFPDGSPTEELHDLYNPVRQLLLLAANQATSERQEDVWKEMVRVDTDRQYYITMPPGTEIRADRRSRNHWSLQIISPRSPAGKSIAITREVPGDKNDVFIAIGEIAQDIVQIRRGLAELVVNSDYKEYKDIPESELPTIMAICAPDELFFNKMYDQFNSDEGSYPEMASLHKEGLNTTGKDLIILTGIALHETWIHLADERYEEDKIMAKNSGGMVWWEITGGRTSLNKIINSLTHNRHMVVQDTQERIFLKIQNSEQRFVDQMTSRHNCRAKLVEEPEYGETLCGKFHRQPELHSHRCNACNRVKDNNERAEKAKAEKEAAESQAQSEQSTETKVAEAAAIQRNKESMQREPVYPSTSSPDGVFTSGLGSTLPINPIIPPPYPNERQEWEARNGPVITVQGPAPKESHDIQGLAEEYRRVSDELVERASYYATLAEKYETLLQPTDAVKEAEAALALAREQEQAEREAQIKALQDMLAAGPPA